MASPSRTEYKSISVTGPVSVGRVNRVQESSASAGGYWSLLLMGPTGSGKSTFIESLGLAVAERISSNQLEGFTQKVTTYKLKNVTTSGYSNSPPIYLVDSPGFADTQISTSTIVSMLQKWGEYDEDPIYFYHILYLMPITQVRMPGSQRQVLETFQALTGVRSAESITIVTTMWDSVWGERAIQRAETTHQQLEAEIWKEYIGEGARIVKFHNTQDSALLVLDEALRKAANTLFNLETNSRRDPSFVLNLYTDLRDRIQNRQSEIATIQSDLAHAEADDDHWQQLRAVLLKQLEEAQKYLVRFQEELQEFGPPPPNFKPPHLNPGPNLMHVNGGGHGLTVSTVRDNISNAHSMTAVPPVSQPVHNAQEPIESQHGRLSRARDFIMSRGRQMFRTGG